MNRLSLTGSYFISYLINLRQMHRDKHHTKIKFQDHSDFKCISNKYIFQTRLAKMLTLSLNKIICLIGLKNYYLYSLHKQGIQTTYIHNLPPNGDGDDSGSIICQLLPLFMFDQFLV